MTARETLARPLALPNGTTLVNRLAKSAMSEQLGSKENAPTDGIVKLYETWGKSGAGLQLTGNVMVDRRALGEPGNVVLEDGRNQETFARWAAAAQADGAQAWVQINHPGRQAPRMATSEPVAPSAVELKGMGKAFIKPRALEEREIHAIVARFATTARLSVEAGFAGVQIHGAHGYLVSQFLSPRTNIREDGWGGSPENRKRFLLEIVRAIRAAIGPKKSLGLKLNSADFQRGGFTEEESMDVVRTLNDEHIDLLEISGGTYESWADSRRPKAESTLKREAYFLEYAEKVRAIAQMPLMLTGGLRSLHGMAQAVDSGAVDVIGLARPLCVEPDLPRRLLAGEADKALAIDLAFGIKGLDDFVEVSWYQQQIQRISRGQAPDPASCRVTAVLKGLTHAFTHRPRPPTEPLAEATAPSS